MWKSVPRAFRRRSVRKERARRSPRGRWRSYQSRRRPGACSRAFVMRIGSIERNRRRRAVENAGLAMVTIARATRESSKTASRISEAKRSSNAYEVFATMVTIRR